MAPFAPPASSLESLSASLQRNLQTAKWQTTLLLAHPPLSAAAASSEPTLFSSDKWLPSMRQKKIQLENLF